MIRNLRHALKIQPICLPIPTQHTSNSSSKLQGASMQASWKGKTSWELFGKSGSPKMGYPIVHQSVPLKSCGADDRLQQKKITHDWTDPIQSRTPNGNACKMRRKKRKKKVLM